MTVFRQKTHEVSMNEILHADRFSCALVFDACDRCGGDQADTRDVSINGREAITV